MERSAASGTEVVIGEKPAEWRPNPFVERQIDLARQAERSRKRIAWGLALASTGLCPVACIGPCAAPAYSSLTWLPCALLVVPPVIFALLLRWHRRQAKESKAQLKALREEFGEVNGWFVRLTVYQGEAVSGRDIGSLWFEDGRLYFAGARTSFGLGLDDTHGKALPGDTLLDPGVNYALPLRTTTPVGKVTIGFSFVTEDVDHHLFSEESFRRLLRQWFSDGEHAKGQIPPLAAGVDLPATPWLLSRAVASTAAFPILALAVLSAAYWHNDVWFVVTLGLGLPLALCAVICPPHRSWRAVRDRRRLELAMRQDKNP